MGNNARAFEDEIIELFRLLDIETREKREQVLTLGLGQRFSPATDLDIQIVTNTHTSPRGELR